MTWVRFALRTTNKTFWCLNWNKNLIKYIEEDKNGKDIYAHELERSLLL